MDYIFGSDNWGASFNMPYTVINYLNECSEAQLKVLLCIFSGSRATNSAILARTSGISEAEVDKAVEYWRSRGVIYLDYRTDKVIIPEIKQQDTSFSWKNEPVSFVEPITPTSEPVKKEAVVHFSNKELTEKIEKDNDLRYLSQEIQSMQFSIKGKQLEDLVNLYEYYGFDVKTILLCAEYCKSAGKYRIKNLYDLMKEFYDDGYTSYKDVDAAIIKRNAKKDYLHKVLIKFGFSAKPTPDQKRFIEQWRELGITVEMLEIAYNRCVDNIKELSFEYINGIVNDWVKKSIATPAQAEKDRMEFKAKNTYKNKKNDDNTSEKKSTSYDLDEFENFALNYVLNGGNGKEGNK